MILVGGVDYTRFTTGVVHKNIHEVRPEHLRSILIKSTQFNNNMLVRK